MHIHQPCAQRAHRHPPTDLNLQLLAVYIRYQYTYYKIYIHQPRARRAHRHPPTDINPQFWAVYIQYKGRPYVCPTLWSSDLMVVWPYDRLTLWLSDLMIVRYYLVTWTLWTSDLMIVWPYDRLTLCSSELMIWPYVCPVKLENLWSDLMFVRETLWSSMLMIVLLMIVC